MSDFNSGFLIGVLASLLFALFVIQIMYWKNKIKAAMAAFKKPKNTADATATAAIAAIKAGRGQRRSRDRRKHAPAASTPAPTTPTTPATPAPAMAMPMPMPIEDEGYWEGLASDCGWEQDDNGFSQDYYDLG